MTTTRHAVHFVDTDHNGQPTIELKRLGPARYRLINEFRYLDHELGVIWIKPFETDLASVPRPIAWITPTLGTHTPAAIVHDAMIGDRAYEVVRSPDLIIDRDKADSIMLDAMTSLGVLGFGRVTIWSAVRMATAQDAHPVRGKTWFWLMFAFCLALAPPVVGFWDYIPWIADWPFFARWGIAALAIWVVGTVLALSMPRYIKPLSWQAAVFGMGFLPTLLMLPGLILFTLVNPVLAWISSRP